jgi:hypothetical protein
MGRAPLRVTGRRSTSAGRTAPRGPSVRASGFALVLALAGAVPARAQEALYLRWNECASLGGTADRGFNCVSDLQVDQLVVSFQAGRVIDQVIGIEVVIDLQHSAASVPPWWQMGLGGCRASDFVPSADFTPTPGCDDAWQGHGTALLQDFRPGDPYGLPSQSRILLTVAVPSEQSATFDATTEYAAVRLAVDHLRSSGSSECTGCSGPACLVLNSVLLLRPPAAPGGNVLLVTPGAGDANRATWQGGAGAPCEAVPTRATTWGRLKGIYR